ncbi:ABC transporter substrate-binding protein [Streptosporangium sp. NPDC051022]|uniref:ABC transporter substrate-binding protein n=1 Tax=Streptosporangium sp. NPDC051022 TaxID=3155752 RepID=UPI003438D008
MGLRSNPLTVVLVCVAFAAMACSGESTTKGSDKAASGPSGTLRVATDTPPDNWDPADATPQDVNMLYYQGPYDFLVNTDETGKIVPGLATAWTQKPDSLTLTLRPGVTFTDGTPFDAAAVKANLEHIQKDGIPPNKRKFANVTSIDVVSPTEVKINFSRPTPQLLDNLARQQGLMASPKALADPQKLKTNPVGTGGWTLDTAATIPNSKYVFTANPNYWNKAAQGFQKIEIHLIEDQQARTNALMTRKVDWINMDNQFADQVKGAGFEVKDAPGFPYYLQILDREGKTVPAFKDARVRRAMAMAIDQQAFYKVTNSGFGTPSNQWAIQGQYGFDPGYTGLAYDPAKAQSLLKEAGAGPFTFTVPSYGPFDVKNEAIAGFLAKIGITMKLETAQTGNLSGAAASGKYAAAILPAHETHPQDFYESRVAKGASLNPFGVTDPAVDAIMKKITGVDPAADEETYRKMAAEVSEEGIVIPIGVVNCTTAFDAKKITGVQVWPWTCANTRFAGIKPANG